MITEAWEDYAAKVLPPGAPEVQRTECRRAFWAGAAACFFGVLRRLDGGTEPTESDLRFMDEVKTEFDAYAAECKAQAARMLGPGVEIHNRPPSIPLDRTCNRKGCDRPSRWQVAMVFFAPGHTRAHQGMRAESGIALCEEHGKAATVDDYVTDEGFAKVSAMLKAAGKMPPDRGATKLMLLPIFRVES
jgi:hypothetical protein